jgi:hypothetical protein
METGTIACGLGEGAFQFSIQEEGEHSAEQDGASA